MNQGVMGGMNPQMAPGMNPMLGNAGTQVVQDPLLNPPPGSGIYDHLRKPMVMNDPVIEMDKMTGASVVRNPVTPNMPNLQYHGDYVTIPKPQYPQQQFQQPQVQQPYLQQPPVQQVQQPQQFPQQQVQQPQVQNPQQAVNQLQQQVQQPVQNLQQQMQQPVQNLQQQTQQPVQNLQQQTQQPVQQVQQPQGNVQGQVQQTAQKPLFTPEDLLNTQGGNQQPDVIGQLKNHQLGFQSYVGGLKIPQGTDTATAQATIQDAFTKGLSVQQAQAQLDGSGNNPRDYIRQNNVRAINKTEETLKFAWGEKYKENIQKINDYVFNQSGGDKESAQKTLLDVLKNPVMSKAFLEMAEKATGQVQTQDQMQQAQGVQGQIPQSQGAMNTGNNEQTLEAEWSYLMHNPQSVLHPANPNFKDPVQINQAKLRLEQITDELYKLQTNKQQMQASGAGQYFV